MSTLDLGQVVSGEVRIFDRATGEAVSSSCDLVPGETHGQQSSKHLGWMTLSLRLRSVSEAGDDMTSLYHLGEGLLKSQ